MVRDCVRRPTRAEAFAGRMLELLNGGAFGSDDLRRPPDGLASTRSRSTTRRRARSSPTRPGSNERYVREWLGAMTTGRIVEVDPETGRYSLPRGARSLAYACGLSRQPRGRGAVDHEPLRGRGRHRRRASRTAAACRTSASPASTRSWPRRAPRPSSRCCSRTSSRSFPGWSSASTAVRRSSTRLRPWSRAAHARRALSRQHVPRLRPVGGGNRLREAEAARRAASGTSASSNAT